MDSKPTDALLPEVLLAEVEAVAAYENRPAREILREAVERYLRDRPFAGANGVASEVRPDPIGVARRMRERRKLHPLPDGMSIRDLLTFGRA